MSDIYNIDFNSRTCNDIKRLISEREEEIKYLENALKEKQEISKEAEALKSQIEKIVNENPLPYILIEDKLEKKSILTTSGLKVSVTKLSSGAERIQIICPNGGANIEQNFSLRKHYLSIVDKNYYYSRDLEECDGIEKQITEGFRESCQIRDLLIKGLNEEIVDDYRIRKAKLNTVFPTHYHSYLTINDTEGKHECK